MEQTNKIEQIAQEMARKYRKKMYGLGSVKKYCSEEISIELKNAKDQLGEPYGSQMVKRFYQLVGLDGDPGKANDKLLKDFPGQLLQIT